MDTGTTIMGIFILAIVILPFIIIGYGKKSTEKQLIAKIDELAFGVESKITNYGLAPNLVIGLDRNKGMLFYYNKTKNSVKTEIFSLLNFSDCKLLVTTRKVKLKGEVSLITDKIDFVLREKYSEKTKKINLYDSEKTFDLTKELQLGREWEQIIQNKILELFQTCKAI